MLLGGSAGPVGWSVAFLERPYPDAVEATAAWLQRVRPFKQRPVTGSLANRLAALEPPRCELLLPVGDRWTAQVARGGDSESWVGHLSDVLECHGVLATHRPRGQDEFPVTMFEYIGPEGKPPLNGIRWVSAGIFDEGRWRFDTYGAELPFEEPEAYEERLVRDRFTRPMLVRYLGALGIDVDDEAAFGSDGMLFVARSWFSGAGLALAVRDGLGFLRRGRGQD